MSDSPKARYSHDPPASSLLPSPSAPQWVIAVGTTKFEITRFPPHARSYVNVSVSCVVPRVANFVSIMTVQADHVAQKHPWQGQQVSSVHH